MSRKEALRVEFELQRPSYQQPVTVPVVYKGREIGEYGIDLLVEEAIIVEIKSVEGYEPVFESQLLTYLRMTGKKACSERSESNGIKRFIL